MPPNKGKGGRGGGGNNRGPASRKVMIRLLPHGTDQAAVEKAVEECGYKFGADLDFLYFVAGKMRYISFYNMIT
jgi:hypothetical protein